MSNKIDKVCIVNNRSAGAVVYKILDGNIRRYFQPGETKKIPASELEKLTFQTGGRELIANYLQVIDEQVVADLNIPAEPEYWMNEAQVRDLLLTGSLDAFLDALDFAPEGVIDLIKKYAVSLPLNDMAKREALKKKTGFDTTAAVQHIQEERETDEDVKTEAPKRRVQPKKEASELARRSTTNYKVVTKQEG